MKAVRLDRYADRRGEDAVADEAPRHMLRELLHNPRGLLLEGMPRDVAPHRRLIGIALRFLRRAPDADRADAICRVPDIRTALFAEACLQDLLVCVRGIADRVDSHRLQAPFGRAAAAEQLSDRKRPELLRNLLRPQRVDTVRLLEIARRLREQLI